MKILLKKISLLLLFIGSIVQIASAQGISASALAEEAANLAQQEKFEEAYVFACQAVEKEPNQNYLWLKAALALELKKYEVIDEIISGIGNNPISERLLEVEAASYIQRERYNDALNIVEALNRNGGTNYQLSLRAQTYEGLGRYQDALDDYIRLTRYADASAWEFNKAGEILLEKMNRPNDAIPYFENAVNIAPLNPFNYVALAEAYRQAGFTKKAEETQATADAMYGSLVDLMFPEKLQCESAVVTENYTILKMLSIDTKMWEWCQLDANAYIVANGKKYKLIRAEGIEIAPNHTYYNDNDIRFTLYFPKLPAGVEKIDFIESEDSSWKVNNIQIRYE